MRISADLRFRISAYLFCTRSGMRFRPEVRFRVRCGSIAVNAISKECGMMSLASILTACRIAYKCLMSLRGADEDAGTWASWSASELVICCANAIASWRIPMKRRFVHGRRGSHGQTEDCSLELKFHFRSPIPNSGPCFPCRPCTNLPVFPHFSLGRE